MTTPIPCDHDNCNLPSARIINGALVIESQHYGKKHRCTISLQYLINLLTGDEQPVLDSVSTKVQHKPVNSVPP